MLHFEEAALHETAFKLTTLVESAGADILAELENQLRDVSEAWPSISKTFGATGRFTWHDEVIDATIEALDKLAGTRWRVAAQAADVAVVAARAAVRGASETDESDGAGEPLAKPPDEAS